MSVPRLVPGSSRRDRRRREHRAGDEILRDVARPRLELRRVVDQIRVGDALAVEGWRLGRKRLRRRRALAGHVRLRNRPLLDRPHRLAVRAVEHEQEAVLVRLHHRLDSAAVDGDVAEHRRADVVPFPEVVMNRLEVPHALAGLRIERDERIGEQVVAGPPYAVRRRRSARSAECRRSRALRRRSSDSTRRDRRRSSRSRCPRCRCRIRPGCGTTWNVQSSLPLCASKPRTSSGAASFLRAAVARAGRVAGDDDDIADDERTGAVVEARRPAADSPRSAGWPAPGRRSRVPACRFRR